MRGRGRTHHGDPAAIAATVGRDNAGHAVGIVRPSTVAVPLVMWRTVPVPAPSRVGLPLGRLCW